MRCAFAFGLLLSVSLAVALGAQSTLAAASDVRLIASGPSIIVDIYRGNEAAVPIGDSIRFDWEIANVSKVAGVSLGFRVYSPDLSIAGTNWNPNGLGDTIIATTPWNYSFDLFRAMSLRHFDGVFPDSFLTGGVALENGLAPSGGDYVKSFYTATNSGQEPGVFCIDTTFIPPAGKWAFAQFVGGESFPTWGGGGYGADGFCVTVYDPLSPPGAPRRAEVRVSGAQIITPDPIGGRQALARINQPIDLAWKIFTPDSLASATLSFRIFSPDLSISSLDWNTNTLGDTAITLAPWPQFGDPGGGAWDKRVWTLLLHSGFSRWRRSGANDCVCHWRH